VVLLRLDVPDGIFRSSAPALDDDGEHGDQRDEQEGHYEQQGRDGGVDGEAFEPVLAQQVADGSRHHETAQQDVEVS